MKNKQTKISRQFSLDELQDKVSVLVGFTSQTQANVPFNRDSELRASSRKCSTNVWFLLYKLLQLPSLYGK